MKQNGKIEQRVEELLAQMTVEEKVAQMQQVSRDARGMTQEKFEEWKKAGVGAYLNVFGEEADEIREYANQTRLKIPPLFGTDAIYGYSLYNGATIFPSQLAMACSWNSQLLYEVGKVTAKEVAGDGLNWALSPVLSISRDHRWGRVGETFGEDTHLVSTLGEAIVKGYEEDGYMIACAKHYIGYGETTGGRDSYDTQVTDRKIRETLMPPFKKAIDAGCSSVMTARGSIDGTPLAVNRRVVRKMLKEENEFNGFVVTDRESVDGLVRRQKVAQNMEQACKMTIEAGNDMSMNTPEFLSTTVRLVKEGKIAMDFIDDAVRRILRVKFALGLFDEDKKLPSKEVIGCEEHKKLNLEVEKESIVLLKNDGVLPLKNYNLKIAVIGPNADDLHNQYGDWNFFNRPDFDGGEIKSDYSTIYGGIKEEFRGAELSYARGCDIMDENDQNIKEAVRVGKKSDLIVVVVGDSCKQNGECRDRADLSISGAQTELVKELAQLGKPIVTVLVNGKPLVFHDIINYSNAIIETFNGGDRCGEAVARLIKGEYCPSGRLPITFPQSSECAPCYYNQYHGWQGGKYIDTPQKAVYPFGYGLSYTDFAYANLRIEKSEIKKEGVAKISLEVTNTGDIDGKEVVQLYVKDLVSSVITPVMQLKDFKKVLIKAGETVTVTFSLPAKNLGVWTDEGYIVESGDFEIMVGKNSADYLKTILTIK